MFDTPQEDSSDTVIAVVEAPPEKELSRKRATRTDEKTRREPNWHVIIWNDEVHTYEYVIELLMTLFGHSPERAYQITREVDKSGKGIAWTCHKEGAHHGCRGNGGQTFLPWEWLIGIAEIQPDWPLEHCVY